jgi:DNA repair exonuclease SbcCD ATPase subunit
MIVTNMKENIHQQIENKFSLIERRLKNSFQAIKKDNNSIKEKIQVLEDFYKKLDFNKELEKIKQSLEKDILENKEQTNLLKLKISKKDIKEEIKKEIFPIFENKLKVFVKKEKIDSELNNLRDSFEEKINNEDVLIKKIQDNFEELKKENEKNLIELDRKNKEEIKKLKKQISYLKGRTKNFPEKKGFFSSVVDGLADEKKVSQTIVVDASKKGKPIVKKKSLLNKLVDSLAD